jgi:hypothetical protein
VVISSAPKYPPGNSVPASAPLTVAQESPEFLYVIVGTPTPPSSAVKVVAGGDGDGDIEALGDTEGDSDGLALGLAEGDTLGLSDALGPGSCQT